MRMLLVNGVLMAMVGLAVVGGQVLDRPEASVEATVRRYASAVSNADLEAAMVEIAPDQRPAWTDWVRGQLGNVYDITGIAVRSASVSQRLLEHRPAGPFEVTTAMDVNRAYPDEFYQPSTRVPLEELDGRWYLAQPLLSTE